MVARGWGGEHGPPSWEPEELDAGDIEGPLHIRTTTLALHG
ncbi:MAG TPA: hypothetical protein VF026_25115 [Ktedonobacteraceae bacterium]